MNGWRQFRLSPDVQLVEQYSHLTNSIIEIITRGFVILLKNEMFDVKVVRY